MRLRVHDLSSIVVLSQFFHSRTSCNKTEFGMDYLPFLCSKLTKPLIDEVC